MGIELVNLWININQKGLLKYRKKTFLKSTTEIIWLLSILATGQDVFNKRMNYVPYEKSIRMCHISLKSNRYARKKSLYKGRALPFALKSDL